MTDSINGLTQGQQDAGGASMRQTVLERVAEPIIPTTTLPISEPIIRLMNFNE